MLSELDNYLQRIEDLRGQVRSLIVDLPVEALNWRPTEGVDEHAAFPCLRATRPSLITFERRIFAITTSALPPLLRNPSRLRPRPPPPLPPRNVRRPALRSGSSSWRTTCDWWHGA